MGTATRYSSQFGAGGADVRSILAGQLGAAMKRKRFSEEQVIGILKEAEAAAKTKDLCRKHGISDVTLYN
jgi:hypothetical protein